MVGHLMLLITIVSWSNHVPPTLPKSLLQVFIFAIGSALAFCARSTFCCARLLAYDIRRRGRNRLKWSRKTCTRCAATRKRHINQADGVHR